MGDVLTLIDKARRTSTREAAGLGGEACSQGAFTLEDFLGQLREMQKLGPIQDLMKMLPGMPGGKNAIKDLADQVDEGKLRQAEALILSHDPGRAAESRYHLRVPPPADRPRGGLTTSDVNALLKDFEGARKMMRTMMGGGSASPA